MKILESLLLLLDKMKSTIEYSRTNLSFILVYNESVTHGEKQYNDCSYDNISDAVFGYARKRKIRFGLRRYKDIYFKEVLTYNRSEFESDFIDKYITAHT